MIRTGLLMAALTVLLVMVGGVLGGEAGLVFAFALAVVFNGSSDLSGVTKSETLGAGQECPAYERFSQH